MATCDELQARLTDAEAALHKLMTGSLGETVKSGEKLVTFTAANVGNLSRYIADLRAQVAACTGQPVAGQRRVIQVIPGC